MEGFLKNLLIGLIVLTVAGMILTSIGKFGVFGTLENIGKISSSIGIAGLIIFLIVYLKIRHLENEAKELDVLDKALTS
jgi:hypothetical protein